MDLLLKDKLFVVCGATSGFGLSTLKALTEEKAKVIAVARTGSDLLNLQKTYDDLEILCGDITQSKTIDVLLAKVNNRSVQGVLVNAGGPPAMQFAETTMKDWDEAYRKVLRWKVALTQKLLPSMKGNYGRFLYIESSAVKQPIENLILSTSLRLSVIGFVKSISQEMSHSHLTFNVIAPGMHGTPALERLFEKKAKDSKISISQAKISMIDKLPMKKLGEVANIGKLAAWLFSPFSSYMSGQTINVDGGNVRYIFG